MVRKILAIFMSMLMLMMSMAVYATETEHVHEECCCEEVAEVASEIQPRYDICGACGTGRLVKKLVTASNPYKTRVERDCIHHYYGTDLCSVYKREYQYICNNSSCGVMAYTTSASDVYIVTYCGGYD